MNAGLPAGVSRLRLPVLIAVLVSIAAPATASAILPPPDGGGGGTSHPHVKKLRPWKSNLSYKITRTYTARAEAHGKARRVSAQYAKGSWLPITCQYRIVTGPDRGVWSRLSGAGFAAPGVFRTYTSGFLAGVPRCANPAPNHVWKLKAWKYRYRYRMTKTTKALFFPGFPTTAGTVKRGTWVPVRCEVRGGFPVARWVAMGRGYVPASRVARYAGAKRLPGVPKCGEPRKYVALGDSYQSGLGANRYFSEKYPPGGAYSGVAGCRRSHNAYSQRIKGFLKGGLVSVDDDFLACQGAVTSDVIDNQVPFISKQARLITLGIGGNDLGFSSVVKACVLHGGNCKPTIEDHVGDLDTSARSAQITKLVKRLRRTYNAVRKVAPKARVLVVAYPPAFRENVTSTFSCYRLSGDEAKWLGRAGRRVNAAIKGEVARHKNFGWISLAGRFKGHEACSGSHAYVNGVVETDQLESFHPNERGQLAMSRAIRAQAPHWFR